MIENACERIGRTLGELFICAPVGEYLRIRTPLLYPDGDVIDVFLAERAGIPTITDLGETLRWLRMQSLSTRRTPKQQKLIEDICLNHGLELYRGMLMARVAGGVDAALAATVIRVAQGALRVADLWFTLRTRTVESVSEEVEVFLTDKNIPFGRSEPWVGRSGRTWRVDFHTRTPRRSSLVYVLSTGSRAAARNVAEHVLAGWYDLSNLRLGQESLQFVSLFDDTMDVWSAEDFKLVQDLSTIARWSNPDELADLLETA
jgi:hypothetical protein